MNQITTGPVTDDASTNPLLTRSDLPFELPPFERIRADHFVPAFEHLEQQVRRTLADITQPQTPATFVDVVEPLERDHAATERVLAPLHTLTGSDTTPPLQALEDELAPRVAALADLVDVDAALLEKLREVRAGDATMSPEQSHVVERRIKAMTLAGAALTPEAAEQVKAINGELATLGAEFDRRLLADTAALAVVVEERSSLAGLDDAEIDALARPEQDGGGYVIPLTYPTGHPYLARLRDRDLRRRIMTASTARCSRGDENDTRELVRDIARLRARRAALLGFDSHAAWATADSTARTPQAVLDMLAPIARAAGENARAEIEVLAATAREDGVDTIESWDHAYYAEQVRARDHDVDLEALRPYFELERVLERGVFAAAEQLYGLTFTPRADLRGWNADTRVFEVHDEDGGAVGLYLLDPYARPSKRGGAWMHPLVEQNDLLGQAPVVCNNLNVTRPSQGEPTLMTFDEVETFFHEFGHALHGLLSQVRHPSVSGPNVERDFVEFPSKVNEMWMLWPSVVERYAQHVETAETLPEAVRDRLEASATCNQGFATSELVGAALLDFSWHLLTEQDEVPSVEQMAETVRRRYGLDIDAVPSRYAAPYFQHVFSGGYSAGYYGYLWSEVLDADACEWFVENGGATRENGRRFAERILGVGGGADPMGAYESFRGRAPSPGPMFRRRGLEARSSGSR